MQGELVFKQKSGHEGSIPLLGTKKESKMNIRDYTSKLYWDELKAIIEDFEEFERVGAIGDCVLRTTAANIEFAITKKNENVVIWMNMVAHDCYRLIAEKAMEQGFTLAE